MSQPLPRASRRTALGGTIAGALGLAGCAVGPGAGDAPAAPVTTTFGSRSDGSTAAPGGGEDTDPDTDPDVALVEVVLRQLTTAHHVVRENRRANPGLSARLRPIERLHAVHAAELGGLRALTTTVPDAGGRSAVLEAGGGTEQQLERRLVRGSVEAAAARWLRSWRRWRPR